MLYYISTGRLSQASTFWFDKRRGDCADHLIIGILGTFLGFFLIIVFNMVSAAWVNITIFQLSINATYVSVSAIIAYKEKRKKLSSEYRED